MLHVCESRFSHDCEGKSRRDFLQIGTCGLGGFGLSQLLAMKQAAARAGISMEDKAVVLLFLQGGPPHIEMFDPKMTAPVEVHSATGEVKTRIPGVTFGGTFPQLAQRAERLTVVRSYGSGNASHTYQQVASGGNPLNATMGAAYARMAGTNHPETGIPRNILILPEVVQSDLKLKKNFETEALPTLTSAGDLGSSYSAFNPVGGGDLQQNMQMRLTRGRFQDRRYLMDALDTMKRRFETSTKLNLTDKYQQQAFDVIVKGVAEAFDWSKEDAKTIARYDTSHLFSNEAVHRWFDMSRASNLLGKQMLLARRLCEAGCGFITVSDCGWDFHSNQNSPRDLGGMSMLGPQVDHAVAAFLDDVQQRGLSDKILLIITGEMGRTPRRNRNGGRDHYGGLTTLAFAGGGLQMGQVIGKSDRLARYAATEAYRPAHLVSSVMNSLFDLGQLRLERGVPTGLLSWLEQSPPIETLF